MPLIHREKLTIDGLAGPIEAILEMSSEILPLSKRTDNNSSSSFDHLLNSPSPNLNLPHAMALVAHPHPLYGGSMDNKVTQTLAKTLVESGMAVLRWNFRGVGRSAGEYSEGHGETDDVHVLVNWLKQRFPHVPLYAGGFSFGAFVIANAHLKNHFTRMVLIGTAVNHFSVAWVPSNTIIIHGSADTTVPLSGLLQWAEPQSLTVHVMEGADHFFHQRLIDLRTLITTSLYDGRDSLMPPQSC